MSSRYKFSEEEINAIKQARKENTNKRVEARLNVLELRAEGKSSKEVSEHVFTKGRDGGKLTTCKKKNESRTRAT